MRGAYYVAVMDAARFIDWLSSSWPIALRRWAHYRLGQLADLVVVAPTTAPPHRALSPTLKPRGTPGAAWRAGRQFQSGTAGSASSAGQASQAFAIDEGTDILPRSRERILKYAGSKSVRSAPRTARRSFNARADNLVEVIGIRSCTARVWARGKTPSAVSFAQMRREQSQCAVRKRHTRPWRTRSPHRARKLNSPCAHCSR